MAEKNLRYGQAPLYALPLIVAVLERYQDRGWLTSGQVAKLSGLDNYRKACRTLGRLHDQRQVERKWVKNPLLKASKGGGNIKTYVWVYRWAKKNPADAQPGEGR